MACLFSVFMMCFDEQSLISWFQIYPSSVPGLVFRALCRHFSLPCGHEDIPVILLKRYSFCLSLWVCKPSEIYIWCAFFLRLLTFSPTFIKKPSFLPLFCSTTSAINQMCGGLSILLPCSICLPLLAYHTVYQLGKVMLQ